MAYITYHFRIVVQDIQTYLILTKKKKKSQTFPRREPNYHEGIDYLCSGHSSAQLRQIPLVDDNGQLWGEIRSENYIHHNPNISSSNASQNMPELISL